MSGLDSATRQLLVMVAFAAANHGLLQEALSLLEVLPWITKDHSIEQLCRALLLLGVGRPQQALNCLASATSDEAVQLRKAILDYRSVQQAARPSWRRRINVDDKCQKGEILWD